MPGIEWKLTFYNGYREVTLVLTVKVKNVNLHRSRVGLCHS